MYTLDKHLAEEKVESVVQKLTVRKFQER